MKYALSLLMLPFAASFANAVERETREYRVSADGKPAGTYTMTIERREDGSIVQTGKADVTARVLIHDYKYTYQGTETWREGRLESLESTTNDDGTPYRVKVEPSVDGLKVTINGRSVTASKNVWTTSYWKAPRVREGAITLLDVDTGKTYDARIKPMTAPVSPVGGQAVNIRLQVVGTINADLMYDARDRLLRQETMEGTHKTLIELVRVVR
ncbi:MAG: DUF6134 family protein [Gemmataceae bacterium]